MADEVPKGRRFSLVYMDRGTSHRDSMRFRRRLYGVSGSYLMSPYDLGERVERELGVQLPWSGYGHNWRKFFEEAELPDVLDTITLIYLESGGNDGWLAEVARVLAEEGMGYRLDARGGVHFAVDEDFEAVHQATLAGLGAPRYASAHAVFKNAHGALDADPPDTRAAIRNLFEACETVFKLILDNQVARLGSSELEKKLKPMALAGLEGPARVALSGLLNTFARWVDSAHLYRHGQGVEQPAPPSTEVAVASVQIGSALLRWLIAFDMKKAGPSGSERKP